MKIFQVKYKSSFSDWQYVYCRAESPEAINNETVFYLSYIDCRDETEKIVDKFEASKIFEAIKK